MGGLARNCKHERNLLYAARSSACIQANARGGSRGYIEIIIIWTRIGSWTRCRGVARIHGCRCSVYSSAILLSVTLRQGNANTSIVHVHIFSINTKTTNVWWDRCHGVHMFFHQDQRNRNWMRPLSWRMIAPYGMELGHNIALTSAVLNVLLWTNVNDVGSQKNIKWMNPLSWRMIAPYGMELGHNVALRSAVLNVLAWTNVNDVS